MVAHPNSLIGLISWAQYAGLPIGSWARSGPLGAAPLSGYIRGEDN